MPTPKVEYNLGDIILDMPKVYQASKEEYLDIYSMMTVSLIQTDWKLTVWIFLDKQIKKSNGLFSK